jgi:hypothetical protein
LGKNVVIGCDTTVVCLQHTDKLVKSSDSDNLDYVILGRNKSIRGLNNAILEKYRDQKSEKIISFDGIPYVWVYEAL